MEEDDWCYRCSYLEARMEDAENDLDTARSRIQELETAITVFRDSDDADNIRESPDLLKLLIALAHD